MSCRLWTAGCCAYFLLQTVQADPDNLLAQVKALQQENAVLKAQVAALQKERSVPILSAPVAVKSISTETTVAPPASPLWKGDLAVGGSFDRGNTEDNNITITAEADRNTSMDKLSNSLNLNFGRSRSVTTAQRSIQATQYDYYLDPKWYALIHEAGTYDRLAGVQFRLLAGPGIGYYLIKDKRVFLNVELGAVGDVEKYRGEDIRYLPRGLLAENWEYRLSTTTRFFHNAEIFPDLESPGNYLADAHFGVETQLSKPFSIKFTVNDLYNSRPAPTYQKNDLSAVTALAWTF